jgi:hypothetical protein
MAIGANMKIRLIDANRERLAELREALKDLPAIELVEVREAIYLRPPPGLDMIFMTLPAAEGWGPNFRLREAQILTTSRQDQERGFPPFIITGVNLTAADPKDPVSQVRIVLESTLVAARIYNDQNGGRIKDLGFWVMDLTRGVTTTQLSELLHQILLTDPPVGLR